MNDALHSDAPPLRTIARRLLAAVSGRLIIGVAGLLTGVRAVWSGTSPQAEQTLYFANHNSHGDFVLLWATLPADLRAITRPVAGQDYWMASKTRRFVGEDVFNALMIKRDGSAGGANPVDQMTEALQSGDSLIMFPEGTRNTTEEVMLPLKSGLFHIARACPNVRLVPVWIENLKRVLPKGVLVPIPLACSVRYGAPIVLGEDEDKTAFLTRARKAMLDLRPEHDREDEPDGVPVPVAVPVPVPTPAPIPASAPAAEPAPDTAVAPSATVTAATPETSEPAPATPADAAPAKPEAAPAPAAAEPDDTPQPDNAAAPAPAPESRQ